MNFQGLKQAHYRAILADPPWSFRTRSPAGLDGRPQHYSRMSLAEIKDLPVGEISAPDAHLFLWVTGPHLLQAFDVISAWGFTYSAVAFTWVKVKKSHVGPVAEGDLHCGMGYTTRKNAEFVLLGRRGSPKRLAKDVREIVLSPVREHSRKPDAVAQRIERYCAGPYLELFARAERSGWTVWGNETTKFAETGT